MSELDLTLSSPLGGGGASAASYGRMLRALLPPGKVWRLLGGSVLSTVLDACADEIGRLDDRVIDLYNESHPSAASELLAEYEAELDLDSTGTTTERQARIVGHLIARQRYRPSDFQTALAPLLGQAAADVVVIERSRADAVAMADDREIYRFFIYRNPALAGTYYLDSAQALVDKIKPSHTAGYVIESISMLCDNSHSLCDRDILGV